MLALWKKSYDQPKQHIKKQSHYLPTKVRLVKVMVFSVLMYRCESWTIQKSEHQRIDAFELWLEKTLESPLDCKEIHPVRPEGDSPGCSLEGLMLNLKMQHTGHLMGRADSLQKTLMLGEIEGKS